jgi:hypothetical protein
MRHTFASWAIDETVLVENTRAPWWRVSFLPRLHYFKTKNLIVVTVRDGQVRAVGPPALSPRLCELAMREGGPSSA